MVEYEELVSIGIIAVQAMIKNKTEEQLAKYNDAYMGTAVKWAIRNELRHRYKWYSMKHKADSENGEETEEGATSAGKVKEAVYETILSIDGLAASATDNDSPFDFIKDPSALPDEKAEITELSKLIKGVKVPFSEREIVKEEARKILESRKDEIMIAN